MSSKLLINVNDASSAVIPDTSAPDTGMFSVSHADGANNIVGMILPIIGISVLIIAIVAIVIAATVKRKKVNRFTTHTNKHLVAKLTTLSVVVLLGALAAMNLDKLSNLASAVLLVDDLKNNDDNSLTITASDIKIDVDLNDTAVFATGESVVTVDSATEAGYTLMAYVDSTTTDLKNETNKSSTSTITMLDNIDFKNPAALTNNTWGIATTKPTDQTSEVFTGLPTTLDTAMTLKITDEVTDANDKSTFYYGTYITPDLDYGTYSGTTITYIAIANYAGPCNPNATTIQEAVCLQDFAGPNRDQIVESMTPETQYTLMDMRDEKTYTIAMLHSGNISQSDPKSSSYIPLYSVWMTQNLDLDLDSNVTYTNKDTDLGYNVDTGQYETASWTPIRSTYTSVGNQAHTWCVGGVLDNYNYCITNNTPESYDIGDLYWNGTMFDNEAAWDEYYNTCSWSSDDAPYNCNESLNPITRATSSTGISQYHLGNYYNWPAAVAMNDSSSYYNSELIEQSICPAGWTLPRAGDGLDSFYSLLYIYGFDDSARWYDYDVLHGAWMEPLYFTVGGWWDGELYTIGNYASYWSSVAWNDVCSSGGAICAGDAGFNMYGYGGSSYTYSIHLSNRSNGQTIRCVARPVAESWSNGDANLF